MYSAAIHEHQQQQHHHQHHHHHHHHLPQIPDNLINQPHQQHISNGHHPNGHLDPVPQSQRASSTPNSPKDPELVLGVPSISLIGSNLVLGDANSSSTRSWSPLKVVGDGSFGTVWLCDWHGTLPPDTPLSPMQRGAGARAEWSGKRLVAVKRMKKRWEGGWDECRKLKELESLRAIPFHPNIIPLYDSFLLPATKELYFVFESMEGNLYQLIKSRKGRPLAGGLVSSIYRQVVSGLHHIHQSGYFHRDMKPENLLVTTTGLADYQPTSPIAPPGAPPEKDVVVIIKLADFGLARETRSRPPYTEYVSTRWYRAPEVLLRSRDYSNPVDMWALGTILAELINLKPLFPGAGEVDQVARICEVLGDPSHDYGESDRGRRIGGGQWMRGVKMAKRVGFTFPKLVPMHFRSLFDATVPVSLIECIEDLLRYEPEARLTSQQCLDHPYLIETTPRSHPPSLHVSTNATTPVRQQRLTPVYADGLPSVPPRSLPGSHSQSPAQQRPAFNADSGHAEPTPLPEMPSPHRAPFYPNAAQPHPPQGHVYGLSHARSSASELVVQLREFDLPTADLASYGHRAPPSPVPSSLYSFAVGGDRLLRQETQSPDNWDMEASPVPETMYDGFSENHDSPMDVPQSPIVHSLPPDDDAVMAEDLSLDPMHETATPISQHNKLGKLGSLGFVKKNSKWGLSSVFGHGGEKHQPNTLPPVDELNVSSSRSTPSLKRTQSGSTADSGSLPDISPTGPVVTTVTEQKKLKKEQDRQARDAEKARRAQAEKMQREQARAVMQKRNQMIKQNTDGSEIDWQSSQSSVLAAKPRGAAGPKGKQRAEPLPPALEHEEDHEDWLSHRSKARRRDLDDDHSMSSSDVHSISRMSMISFASVDSDPGPTRTFRHRPAHSVYGLPRATSISSLRTSSGRGFSPSARSSNSFDRQFVNEFRDRATFDSALSDTGSPPPMHGLSLSPTQSQWSPATHSDQSFHQQQGGTSNATGSLAARRMQDPRLVTLPPITSLQPQQQQELDTGSHPSSPYPMPHSVVNPMFQVPPFPSPPILPTHHPSCPPHGALPPCSHLLSVADQQRPPSSFEPSDNR